MKKLFVVSDVHGHYTILRNALDRSGFDKENENHVLLCCGDYFDRGNENVEVLNFFEGLERKILLRGNHEDMLLKLLTTGKIHPHQFINGTRQTLDNFFGDYSIDSSELRVDFGGNTDAIQKLRRFIETTVDYYETKDYVFVHGWLPKPDLKNATAEDWIKARCDSWLRNYNGERPLADKTLICGHVPTFCAEHLNITPATEGDTAFYGNGLIALDAGTADSGKINVLVLEEL